MNRNFSFKNSSFTRIFFSGNEADSIDAIRSAELELQWTCIS